MHEASRSNPEPPPRRSRLAPRLAGGVRNAVLHLATWALLVFYVLKRAAHPGLANHDVGWTVFAGGVLLDGGVFGVDVVDNNPPLVYWLCAGVVALARLLGLPPLSVYYVAALALVFVSVTLLRRLLRVTFESAAWGDALSLVVACGLVIGPGIHFGQRDALFAGLALPWIVAASQAGSDAPPRRRLRIAIGALAGIGFALKPHFALLWLGVEAFVALRRRAVRHVTRGENVVIAGVAVVYALAVVVAAPAYVHDIPELFRLHRAYASPPPLLGATGVLALLAIGTALAVRIPARVRDAARACAAAAIAGVLAMQAQGMNFPYHAAPAQACALLAMLLVAAGSLGTRLHRARRLHVGPRGLAALLVLPWALLSTWTLRPDPAHAGLAPLARLIEARGRGEPVLFFSSAVRPAFPTLLFSGSDPASPWSCLWMIAGRYPEQQRGQVPFPYRRLEVMDASERSFVARVAAIVSEQRPRLLFFDRSPWKLSFGATDFDFERYFDAAPGFAVELARHYTSLGRTSYAVAGRPVTLEAFVRRDAAGPRPGPGTKRDLAPRRSGRLAPPTVEASWRSWISPSIRSGTTSASSPHPKEPRGSSSRATWSGFRAPTCPRRSSPCSRRGSRSCTTSRSAAS